MHKPLRGTHIDQICPWTNKHTYVRTYVFFAASRQLSTDRPSYPGVPPRPIHAVMHAAIPSPAHAAQPGVCAWVGDYFLQLVDHPIDVGLQLPQLTAVQQPQDNSSIADILVDALESQRQVQLGFVCLVRLNRTHPNQHTLQRSQQLFFSDPALCRQQREVEHLQHPVHWRHQLAHRQACGRTGTVAGWGVAVLAHGVCICCWGQTLLLDCVLVDVLHGE
mmetsp:Transcript_26978/g.77452  ORF Transcript_26978/g.77452 Transcript_26978/m.77452 type:complete len:220 (-) Transcript_26978:442-1101(-)